MVSTGFNEMGRGLDLAASTRMIQKNINDDLHSKQKQSKTQEPVSYS